MGGRENPGAGGGGGGRCSRVAVGRKLGSVDHSWGQDKIILGGDGNKRTGWSSGLGK